MSTRKTPDAEPMLEWMGSPGHAVGFGLLQPGMIISASRIPAGPRLHPDWRARQNTPEEGNE